MNARVAVEVDEANFAEQVLDRSHEVTVVVDFWAAWCAPCRALGPVLERLASEGAGSWILAKVDTDRNPNLAAAAGVQGIPAVRAFKDGKEIDEFTGAIPEAQVRAWLKGIVPDRAHQLAEEGLESEASGDLSAAEAAFRKALEIDANNSAAVAGLKRLEIRQDGAAVSQKELVDRLASDPDDVQAATQLAKAGAVNGSDTFYLQLIGIIDRTQGEARDDARRSLIEVLELLPPSDPRAIAARKELAKVLF